MTQRIQQDASALTARGLELKAVNGGYTSAEVTVTQDDFSASGDTATLSVTESGRLLYPNVQPGEPDAEEYILPHTLTYVWSGSAWLLSKDEAKYEPNGPTPTTQLTQPAPIPFEEPPFKPAPGEQGPDPDVPVDEGPKESPASTDPLPAGSSPTKSIAAGTTPGNATSGSDAPAALSYSAMVDYADRYWRSPNRSYRTYSNDCTNFISQAMRAGGWGQKDGWGFTTRKNNKYWYYGTYSWTTSYSWAGAENWYWFAKKHSNRTRILDDVWQLGYGDVLQADWNRDDTIDHSMIVTGLGRDIYLTYHTGNTHNRKLSSILSGHRGTWWYAHRT
ncbi:amidase domain-containing protein [Streptomyces melanogenes]|uniref:amidase domain-containing protein n=1 Tax=Streptomyces melanogenes TaxID=67326 RepID=UPI00378EF3C0